MLENENWDIILNTYQETSFNLFFHSFIFSYNCKARDITISNIFSKIKFDPNFMNVNEVILVGGYEHKFIKPHKSYNSLTRIAGSSAMLLDHIVTNID